MLVDEYQVAFWTRGQYPAAPPQTLFYEALAEYRRAFLCVSTCAGMKKPLRKREIKPK